MQTMSMAIGQINNYISTLILTDEELFLTRCPEYDTFEGNSETMGVATHTCDYNTTTNDYPQCDGVSILSLVSSICFRDKPYDFEAFFGIFF